MCPTLAFDVLAGQVRMRLFRRLLADTRPAAIDVFGAVATPESANIAEYRSHVTCLIAF